jgi:hypothetical protein
METQGKVQTHWTVELLEAALRSAIAEFDNVLYQELVGIGGPDDIDDFPELARIVYKYGQYHKDD